MTGKADDAELVLVWLVRKVDLADSKTDDAFEVLLAVADAAGAVDEACADACWDDELLADDEVEDELAWSVLTIVTETETVVGSGFSTSVDLVTVWYTVSGWLAALFAEEPPSTSTTE